MPLVTVNHCSIGGSGGMSDGTTGAAARKRVLLVPRDDADLAPVRPDFQPGGEMINDVEFAGGLDLLQGVAEELRHIRAGRIHQRDLMLEVLRIAELDAGLGDVLKAQVAAVDLIGLAVGNFDGHGHVAEVAADQRKAHVLRA